ncbi:MAG: signal peptidase II [Acidobacteria bacterium]|nr:signal peptidase II [Acidobacteriota bacterium]
MQARLSSLCITAGVFLLDRLTKMLIESRVSVWDTHVIIPGFFNIVHTRNKGAAFSILAEASSDWRALLLIGLALAVSTFVAVLLWQATRKQALGSATLRLALALVLGGAIGNLYDRILYGSVTDFLEIYVQRFVWPAFNVADAAISIGAGLLLLDLWQGRRRTAHI